MVSFWWPYWIIVVFPLVFSYNSFKETFNQLLGQWTDLNILYQYSLNPFWSGVFQIATFLSVALSESNGMPAIEPSSKPCNYFLCYHSIRPFCNVIAVPRFYSKIVFLSSHCVVCLSICIIQDFLETYVWH